MSSQGSATSNLHDQPLPHPPTQMYNDDHVHYTGPFTPSPFELLYLVNTGEHDDTLRLGTAASPVHRITIDGLIRLREQRVALDRIVQETNTYSANLAYNATAGAAGGLVLQGPATVPSLPMYPQNDRQPATSDHTGTIPKDVCDADPNSPEFWMAQAAYAERIRNAAELACEQFSRIPSIPTPSFGLSRPFNRTGPTAPVHPAEQLPSAPSSPTSLVYPDPPSPSSNDSSDGSIVVEHIPPSEPGSPPMYTASIGIRTPTPSDSGTEAVESDVESIHSPQIQGCDNCDPPATVLFRADGAINPYFQPLRITFTRDQHTPEPIAREPESDTNSSENVDSRPDTSSSDQSSSPNNSDDMTGEVYEYLSALCAEWRTTAAENVRATVVRYAGRLRLVTSLEIVVSNDGRKELLETTIPSAHNLLTMISTGVTPTPNSMETESSSSTAAATENAEEQYEWVYTGRQESFREVTLSDGTVARLEFRP
uniref:Uncharacterized protein n=1 Tax=Moniliophthora roreri TaxID=221103 RepID=A0A0W0FC46_MONRR